MGLKSYFIQAARAVAVLLFLRQAGADASSSSSPFSRQAGGDGSSNDSSYIVATAAARFQAIKWRRQQQVSRQVGRKPAAAA